MELYLNSASDFSIQDETGKKYTVDEAKKEYESGNVSDWNLAFHNLIQVGWDIEELKTYYDEE